MKLATLITVAVLAAPAAQACAIQPQSCFPAVGVEAALGGSRGSVVVFDEYRADRPDAIVVVECNSRQSLAVDRPGDEATEAFWDAGNLISDAAFDDAEQTLQQLARQIRRQTGLEARLFTLPAGHCGCDLPNIPRPPSNCPADF